MCKGDHISVHAEGQEFVLKPLSFGIFRCKKEKLAARGCCEHMLRYEEDVKQACRRERFADS